MSFKHKSQAWNELFRRYIEIWGYAWKRRKEISLPDFKASEAEFLPAALAIQAAPVSPVGRWVAKILIFLLLVLLVWSYFGKLDIIVNAQGRIIPTGYTKTISSAEIATVRKLNVEEGQSVKVGDVLIELDTRISSSERDKSEVERQSALLQAERAMALLDSINSGNFQSMNLKQPHLQTIDYKLLYSSQQHLTDQWREYRSRISRLDDEINRYSQTLPLATQRATDYKELAKNNDVSQHAWLEKEQALIDLLGQLADVKNQKTSLIAETRRSAQDALSEAKRIIASSIQDIEKAKARVDLLTLSAPMDGTVQQLSVHTLGAAVPAAQPLMQIVPSQASLEIEAFIENKDIGFIHVGQDAEIKIDTYEYTKYGTVPATIIHISQDAISDEKRGLIYSIKLLLKNTVIDFENKQLKISPGMSGNIDIKIGSRRVIEYVLAPLLQHQRESFNER